MSQSINMGAVSVAESAELLSVSHSTAKVLCRTGELRSFRIGRRRLISHDAIRDFIARQEEKLECASA